MERKVSMQNKNAIDQLNDITLELEAERRKAVEATEEKSKLEQTVKDLRDENSNKVKRMHPFPRCHSQA